MHTIDLLTETPVSLREAANILPRGRSGRPVHLSCILRWILVGAKGPDGQRVRLEGLRIGGRWITSREALQRFGEALTHHLADQIQPPHPTSRRLKASQKAAEELNRIGI